MALGGQVGVVEGRQELIGCSVFMKPEVSAHLHFRGGIKSRRNERIEVIDYICICKI